MRSAKVLQLDIQGTPHAWITLEQAVLRYASGAVVWEEGAGPLAVFRGGHSAALGRQSVIEVAPIVALRGTPRINLFEVAPAFSKAKLLRRDRNTCAYCAQVFPDQELQCEHIQPQSRGGQWSWMNLVAACGPCNLRKGARTPEEAGMPLVYLPYVPSRWEDFLLAARHVRADVHEWLAARLPRGSRLA